MTNLGQGCLFSNLITIPVPGLGFGGVGLVRRQLFYYWFKCRNLLGDDQNFKRGEDVKKGENQNIKGECFFLYQSKFLSHFIPVFQDPTLKRDS